MALQSLREEVLHLKGSASFKEVRELVLRRRLLDDPRLSSAFKDGGERDYVVAVRFIQSDIRTSVKTSV